MSPASSPSPTPTTDEANRPRLRSALRSAPAHARLWITAGVALAADLITKHLAFTHLSYNQPHWVIRDLLYYQLSLNRGAVFGLLPGYAIVFVIASVLAGAFVFYLFSHTASKQWAVQIILGLILGGTLGNLYDRLFCIADIAAPDTAYELRGKVVAHDEQADLYTIGGFPDGKELLGQAPGPIVRQPVVRDFIKIDAHFGSRPLWKWIFNLADAALMIGVVLLLLASLRQHRRQPAGLVNSPSRTRVGHVHAFGTQCSACRPAGQGAFLENAWTSAACSSRTSASWPRCPRGPFPGGP